MNAFTAKTKTLLTLVGLLALSSTAVGAIACAPVPRPDSGSVPEETAIPNPTPEPIELEAVLTPEVSDRILLAVAADVDRPVSTLRIAASEPATWDGCMGIYEPDQACTMIAIFGLRVVVTDGDQSWVYHTRQDGQELVQNPTASGSRNGLIPDFIPQVQPNPEAEPETEPEAHVFRAVESGGLAGRQQETVLLADGRLLQRENGTVVSEQRVTPAQLAAFQQVLEDQRFPNLNRMRYVTDAAFADYPTVQLSAMYHQTEYIDLALDDIPPALQAVIQAWEELMAQAQ